ncbi:MAG: S-layer homology domain-containing protein [Eubacteriales bacterium]|nr:S-layer homology domain-containing protein [Eubacteriales bacterium]
MRKKFLSLVLVLFMVIGLSPGSVVLAVQDPPPPPQPSTLTNLVLSGNPTGFIFASGTPTYNGVVVANSVSSITVTPTGDGTITVNGTVVTSGAPSAAIPLTMDVVKNISVRVEQAGKNPTTYSISVTRKSDRWATAPFDGGGISGDPYIIDTAQKLAYLAEQVNASPGGITYAGKYFEMTADIALNDTTDWQGWDEDTTGLNQWIPIGNFPTAGVFNGIFDGGGHTVSGVYTSDGGSDYQGLFGYVYNGGIVKNLGVSQSFLCGGECVGGVAGRIDTIEYCWFSGTASGDRYVGGVAGNLDRSDGGVTQYCFNTGSVSGMSEVGGVFGIIGESSIRNCYNAGAVSGGFRIGGITSDHIEGVSDCYNSGVVTGLSIPTLDETLPYDTPYYVGAIIGQASYPNQITGCLYDKQMSREAGVGGSAESEDITGTVGKLTTEMCDISLDTDFGDSGDWVFESGLYPRLTGMSTADAALVSAVPVRLMFASSTIFEQSAAVETDFTVGTSSGASWTSGNTNVIAIDGGAAELTRQSTDSNVTLTATKNNASKQVPLKILAAPAAISPTSCDYDLNAPSDVTIQITYNRASSVTGMAYGAAPLATPTDYSVSGSTLTLESGFIAGLLPSLNDTINFVITFNTGETAALTVNVVNSSGSGSGSGGGGSKSSEYQKTITVTETSSEVFTNTAGTITAEANMNSAFSNSVEVKVTDTAEDAANFKLMAVDEIYPFDISLYIRGTNRKTEPADGYTVTISLPIPENLVEKRTSLLVAHKSDDGTVTMLSSRLVQKDGAWYLVFEATEFSPYALVIRNAESYEASAGVPYYTDALGNKVFIGFAANGRYIAPGGVTVSFMRNGKSFTDVAGHWAESYIGFTTERELFFGTGGNQFSPKTGMTRAMFATVLGRLYDRSFGGIATSDAHAFTDCNYGAYYGKYVDWAAENEIIGGIGGGRFAPDSLITREQMAAMLYRFADLLGKFPDGMDTALEYSDAASISSYAKDAALYCQTTGVIGGRTGGVFVPQDTATRAEVAAMIQRFIETVTK